MTLSGWFVHRQRLRELETALVQGRANLKSHHPIEAAQVFQHGLMSAGEVPGTEPLRQLLRDELARAIREAKAGELHRLAELVRFRYGLAEPPAEEAQVFLRLVPTIWKERDLLTRAISGQSGSDFDTTVRTDLLDLAVVWAAFRVRFAVAAEAGDARREALQMLTEAEALLGPSPALRRDHRVYTKALGLASSDLVPKVRPVTAWEYYDLGRSYLRTGKLERAARQFKLGLDLRPQDFWLNFYQGVCAYRSRQFEQAANAFRVCIALSPETAECYYNRALAYQALDELEEAIADYNRALSLNPDLTDAALNRGLLHYRQGQFTEALADLERARATTSTRSTLGVIHYSLALVHRARGNQQASAENARAALEMGHEEARELVRHLGQP